MQDALDSMEIPNPPHVGMNRYIAVGVRCGLT